MEHTPAADSPASPGALHGCAAPAHKTRIVECAYPLAQVTLSDISRLCPVLWQRTLNKNLRVMRTN